MCCMPCLTAVWKAALTKSPICTKQASSRAGKQRIAHFSVRPPVVNTTVRCPWFAATSTACTTLARKAAVE